MGLAADTCKATSGLCTRSASVTLTCSRSAWDWRWSALGSGPTSRAAASCLHASQNAQPSDGHGCPAISQMPWTHGAQVRAQVSPWRQGLLLQLAAQALGGLASASQLNLAHARASKCTGTAQAHRLCSLSFSALSWQWRSLSRQISLCTSTCEHPQTQQQLIHGRPA